MIVNIATEYPIWLLVFCLLIGGGYSSFLYYWNNNRDIPNPIVWLLAILRFSAVSFIAFMLLGPMVKSFVSHTEKPRIVFAQDVSSSVASGKDSTYYNNKYKQDVKNLLADLESDFEVDVFSFSDKLQKESSAVAFMDSLHFNGMETDVSAFFNDLSSRYSKRNIGAVIIASDGVYNKGMNPVYASKNNVFPLYAIALGDTNVYKDAKIKKVLHNNITFLGNRFPVEVMVAAELCTKEDLTLSIYKDNILVDTTSFSIYSDNYTKSFRFMLPAEKSGMQHYKIKLSTVKGELLKENNLDDVFIDVIDNRQKVLILTDIAHPDVAAIKQAIESNNNYEVDVAMLNKFNNKIEAYNLVILYQLPSMRNAVVNLINEIKKKKIPIWYVLGAQSNMMRLRKLNPNILLKTKKVMLNETYPISNKLFSRFSYSDNVISGIEKFPPIESAFGDYMIKGSHDVLFHQKVGNISTKKPMVLFVAADDDKYCVLFGEGLWRWRMHDYMENENHDVFNEIVNKIVQYLAIKEDKSLIRVKNKKSVGENESIEFNAELYNDSYELINDPDLKMNIFDNEGKKYSYVYSRSANSYSLNIGTFPIGVYTFETFVEYGGETVKKTSAFNVVPVNAENVDLSANHHILNRLVSDNNGEIIYPEKINTLAKIISERKDVKSIKYSLRKYVNFIELKWFFVLIVSLLIVEWFVRKWQGGGA